MFSGEIQKTLRKEGFDLESNEENIWIKEERDQSVTISGLGEDIDVIWQNFDGDFEEFSSQSLKAILEWANEKLNK